MKILIVDDDHSLVVFFRRAAIKKGYEHVDTAFSGDEALEMAIRNHYDLITLDINMPGLSGLEIVSPLRSFCPHATIAVVSAFLPSEDSSDVVGCVDVMISKPISLETFSRLLEGSDRICKAREEIGKLGRVPATAR